MPAFSIQVFSALSAPVFKKRSIVFSQVCNIDPFKGRIDCWVDEISKMTIPLWFLNEFLREGSGVGDTAEIKELLFNHLKPPWQNF